MDILGSLSVVLDSINQGIHVVDEKGITVVYNQAASQLDGLVKEEVMGKSLLEVFPSLDHDSSTLMTVLKSGVPELEQQQTFSNYKGKKITTVNSTHPIFIDGELVGACEVSTDITRIKEMAEKIVDLQRELREIGPRSTNSPKRKPSRGTKAHRPRGLFSVDDIVGESSSIKEIKRKVLMLADSDSNVMVWGETGTGKELLVQSIHTASVRSSGPFVPQNCAALPESLLEGLVFGTAKGGFTGSTDRPGLLELASGGTLYLDEIDSMPRELQAKLLRVIQDKRVRRLGDARERPVDVRIVASISVPPREAVKAGHLRPDLFFRLSVIEMGLPPLRERKEDIPLLCEHFLRKHSRKGGPSSVSPQAMSAFLTYEWPGNIRELEHAVEGSLAFAKGTAIDIADLPHSVRGMIATAAMFRDDTDPGVAGSSGGSVFPPSGDSDGSNISSSKRRPNVRHTRPLMGGHAGEPENPPKPPAGDTVAPGPTLKDDLRSQEKALIEGALAASASVSEAARSLGMARQTLQYRMKILGISKDR